MIWFCFLLLQSRRYCHKVKYGGKTKQAIPILLQSVELSEFLAFLECRKAPLPSIEGTRLILRPWYMGLNRLSEKVSISASGPTNNSSPATSKLNQSLFPSAELVQIALKWNWCWSREGDLRPAQVTCCPLLSLWSAAVPSQLFWSANCQLFWWSGNCQACLTILANLYNINLKSTVWVDHIESDQLHCNQDHSLSFPIRASKNLMDKRL